MSRRYSTIPVKAYNTRAEPLLQNSGTIQMSVKVRVTEIAAQRLIEGIAYPEATDSIGILKAQGFKRCGRCGVYKPPEAFSSYKRRGRETEYLHTYCKTCRCEMDKTKRWSNVIPLDPYPKRISD